MDITDLTQSLDPATMAERGWHELLTSYDAAAVRMITEEPLYRLLYDVGFGDGGMALVEEVARRAPDIKAAAILDVLRAHRKSS